MATLIPSYNSCDCRMTSGERRLAQRLESLLEPDYWCWYDVPVGTKYQHPDFVVLHPRRGILILEVKDWSLDSIQRIDPVSVTLLTNEGAKEVGNPSLQARQNAFGVKNMLERDAELIAPLGHLHAGKLICPYGFGVVLANISRKQFESTDLGEVLLPHLVICKDEMTETVEAAKFQESLWAMFNVQFPCVLSMPQIDRIRWHMFPEIRISQNSLFAEPDEMPPEAAGTLLRVMDLHQEQLARSMGDGHRVIHGVAGSGKTLILGYRCAHLAKTLGKPILVLCYNIALATKLESSMSLRGLNHRVSVRTFHAWCSDQLTLYHVPKPKWSSRGQYYKDMVDAVIDGVEREQIPRAQYGAVLIDEGHDFEAHWLKLVTQMIDATSNSLLLLYDDAQAIYGNKRAANFSFKSVGVQAQGRTTILRVNYRNTNEILECAYAFAKDILTPADADDDSVPLLKPEMAGRHGPTPRLAQLSSRELEAKYIAGQLGSLHAGGTPWNQMAVLYHANFIGGEIGRALSSAEIPFKCLKDSRSKRFDPLHDSVKLMTLHSSKGLEFPVVAIAGLGFMPYQEGEAVAEAKLLYVGMTRATERLIMTAHQESAFVRKLQDFQVAA
jgi:UvrD-like helicase C-terminal domain/AAA domain/Nuclease-related domain